MVAAVETMAYTQERGTPWHGQGKARKGLATADEMLSDAGLNWIVEKMPVQVVGGPVVPGKFATVRTSDMTPLGIVGTRYSVVQNHDAFGFADNLVDSGEAKYETAGSLFGGRKVFLSMELEHLDISVPGDDSDVKMFLLVANSHDGTGAADAAITPVRTVCANTLNMALAGAKTRFKIRHSGDISRKILAARDALGITFKYAEKFSGVAAGLSLKQVTDQQVLDILRNAVFPVDMDDVEADDVPELASTLAYQNYLTSETVDGIRGTAWGALNGIGEFLDYGVTYRGRRNDANDTRTLAILRGSAVTKKTAALKALQSL